MSEDNIQRKETMHAPIIGNHDDEASLAVVLDHLLEGIHRFPFAMS